MNKDEQSIEIDISSLAAFGENGETITTTLEPEGGNPKGGIPWQTIIIPAILLAAVVGSALFVLIKKKASKGQNKSGIKQEEQKNQAQEEALKDEEAYKEITSIGCTVGKVHNIGRRNSQQDSLGVAEYKDGILAVVADGMGGLSDGDKVSQRIVLTMLQDSTGLVGGSTEGALYQMVAHVNCEVNRMLGVSDRYKSGSTLIAVLVEAGSFQWVSVGDSRIYLYRGGELLQINREHVYAADLLQKAVNQEIAFEEIAQNPQKKSVSSFIGMGELKYIDGSMRPVRTVPGDRLLLMSDGVFNTLSEQEICDVLIQEKEAKNAARMLEEQVLARQNGKQDNFTAIILDI